MKGCLAVLSGSGMDGLFSPSDKKTVKTRYGVVQVELVSHGGREFYHLARHGPRHSVPPHEINFRANIAGLERLGTSHIVSIHAVGSMNERFIPGQLGLVDQFIDLGSPVTFFDRKPVHTDMTMPYDPQLQGKLVAAGKRVSVRLRRGLVYASVTGPRYETAAEIRMMRLLGADVVGMTGAPEAILANELGLKIASIVVATNWAAGLQQRVSQEEVLSMMRARAEDLRRLLQTFLAL